MFSIIQYVILETCYNDIFTDCLVHLLPPPPPNKELKLNIAQNRPLHQIDTGPVSQKRLVN